MSYDTSTNRELAKTALAIYQKHTIKENVNSGYGNQTLTESNNYAQRRGAPTNLKEAVEDVLLEYASDVVLTAEMNIGKKLNENEINNVAGRLLEYINILPPNQQVTLMQELSYMYEAHGHMKKEEHGHGKKIYEDTPLPPAEDLTSDSGYIYPVRDAQTGGPQTDGRPGVQMLPGSSPATSGAAVSRNFDALAGRRQGVPVAGRNTTTRANRRNKGRG